MVSWENVKQIGIPNATQMCVAFFNQGNAEDNCRQRCGDTCACVEMCSCHQARFLGYTVGNAVGNVVGDAVGYAVETPAHVVGNAVETPAHAQEEMDGEIFCGSGNFLRRSGKGGNVLVPPSLILLK